MSELMHIKTDDTYEYYTDKYDGFAVTFRKTIRLPMRIYVKVDDSFARANGYESMNDLPKDMKEQLKRCFGNDVAWLLCHNGDFLAYPKDILN